MWHGHQALKVWLLDTGSIRAWATWHGQHAFKAWFLLGTVKFCKTQMCCQGHWVTWRLERCRWNAELETNRWFWGREQGLARAWVGESLLQGSTIKLPEWKNSAKVTSKERFRQLIYQTITFFWDSAITPPKNNPIEKENHLPNLHDLGMFILQGVVFFFPFEGVMGDWPPLVVATAKKMG